MRRHEYTSIAYTENRQQNVYLNRCAYVMLLYGCDVEYALGALLIASALCRLGTKGRLLLLHSGDVPRARLKLLRDFYDEVRLISNPVNVPPDSPLCSSWRDFGHSQFLKLHLLELEFDKVLYLDCDVLVLRNLDHLFQLEAPAAMERLMAMPRHGSKLPNRVTWAGQRIRGIQGGVMLLAPDKELFASMRAEVEDPNLLRDLGYTPAVGNEQDYLTWRYCLDKFEELGHMPVWTHLGCEYNYEVHTASMYFAIGRERWLWHDYEHDTAVLHFSAPWRKRAKRILRGDTWEDPRDREDPRIAFAYRTWDEQFSCLREAVAKRGGDLGVWLGECETAHIATFDVVDRGESGMQLRQVTETDANGLFSFEAYSSNCVQGLTFFPPAFAPGPPWGACFWARAAPIQAGDTAEPNGIVPFTEHTVTGTGVGMRTGNSGENGILDSIGTDVCTNRSAASDGKHALDINPAAVSSTCAVEERRPYPCDPSDAEYTHDEFIAFAVENNMPTWQGELNWCEARGEVMEFPAGPLMCNCPKPKAMYGHVEVNGSDELRAVGAWLHLCKFGTERWNFGLMDDAPHQPECLLWRCAAVFYVKVCNPRAR